MLDDPSLTSDKMIEVMSRGMDIVAILMIVLIVLLLYIYRYEIKLLLKYSFSKTKKNISPFGIQRSMKTDISEIKRNELNKKVDELLEKFNNPILDENDIELLKNMDAQTDKSIDDHAPPIFRSVEITKNSDGIIYHFINDGGPIHNYEILADEISISIEPKNELEQKGKGYFKFELPGSSNVNEINFELSYYDGKNKFCKNNYTYSILENKLT